jgi:epoxyqueuosine reductase
LRNLAVALGNAPSSAEVISALRSREHDASPLVAEHVRWALTQHGLNSPRPATAADSPR